MRTHACYAHLIVIMTIFAGTLFSLSFTDSKGKILVTDDDMIIRLVEIPDSDIKTAEAVFRVQAEPEDCYNIIKAVEEYPVFMPDIKKTELVKETDKGRYYDYIYDAPFSDMEYTLFMTDSVSDKEYFIDWDYVTIVAIIFFIYILRRGRYSAFCSVIQ